MIINERVITIAYAEDHLLVRKGIISLIEQTNIFKVVIEGANRNEILNQLLVAESLPDVCLIDLNMPVMNGFELLSEIRKHWLNLPCIILSAFTEEHYIIQLIRQGANGYLFKTCEPKEIEEAIHAVLNDEFHFKDFISQRIRSNILNVKKKLPELNERERDFS